MKDVGLEASFIDFCFLGLLVESLRLTGFSSASGLCMKTVFIRYIKFTFFQEIIFDFIVSFCRFHVLKEERERLVVVVGLNFIFA